MEQLVKIQKDNVYGYVVSSRVIAEELGKRHSDVLDSLSRILTDGNFRSLTEPNVASLIFSSEYKDKKGEMRKEYLLTKDGFTLYMFNIQGYNDFKMAYINKFNELEKQVKEMQPLIPQDYPSALRALAESVEHQQALAIELREKSDLIDTLQPKASYYDLVLQCKDLLTTTMIAKDYGFSAHKLNSLLAEDNIQYKQSGRYFLYAKYAGKGYAGSKTYPITKGGEPATTSSLAWTQKGRLFIYDWLKNKGILPCIERN